MSGYVNRGWTQDGDLLWRCGQCGALTREPDKGSHDEFHNWVRDQFTELRQTLRRGSDKR